MTTTQTTIPAFEVPEAPGLEYALTVCLELPHATGALRTAQMTNALGYAFIGVDGGWFQGPSISGKALPGGGDWPTLRADSSVVFDASYFLQADDGTMIRLHNRGLRVPEDPSFGHGPELVPGVERPLEERRPAYFRTTPLFEVEPGPHDWLAQHVFVGYGGPTPHGNLIHYYRVL